MEWVETTARTVEEAKELALDRLGVHEEDAEFDVLEEPRPGLFGRLRGEARVRARVRPTQPRPKTERRDRKRRPKETDGSASTEADAGDTEAAADAPAVAAPADASAPDGTGGRSKPAKKTAGTKKKSEPAAATAAVATAESGTAANGAGVEIERQAAKAFLEGLADALGEPATAEVVVVGDDEAEIRLTGGELGVLIGPRGQTLLAVQELTRLAAQRRAGERAGRLRIDIAGYRDRRREALSRFTRQVADEVRVTGVAKALEPMASMDRKVVHDTVNDLDGVDTVSEGEEPFRRVVIRPVGDG